MQSARSAAVSFLHEFPPSDEEASHWRRTSFSSWLDSSNNVMMTCSLDGQIPSVSLYRFSYYSIIFFLNEFHRFSLQSQLFKSSVFSITL